MTHEQRKTALITGYSGQDGTMLTKHLLEQGYRVLGLTRRVSTEPPTRTRGKFNFEPYMQGDDPDLVLVEGDLLSVSSLLNIIGLWRPDEIYNLAAQSHVGISFKQPEFTIEANFMGVVNLITAMETIIHTEAEANEKYSPRLYQASTSEMFGDAHDNVPFDENTPLKPNSPYAIAKAAAHFYCKMKRQQGLYIVTGILFNHESEIRGGNFVTQKIARGAMSIFNMKRAGRDDLIRPIKLGNLDAMRDWGYAGDYVKAMHLMMQQAKPDDYVVGTGESHSVRDFVVAAFKAAGFGEVEWKGEASEEYGYLPTADGGEFRVVEVDPEFYRPNDVNFLNGDSTKIKELGWKPEVDFDELVRIMVKEA